MAFPFSTDTPVRYGDALPDKADVAVIGGGIIGVCSALFLARRGLRTVLLEKGRIAAEQSSRNWGWIRQQGRDPDEFPIVQEAVQIWQDLAQQTNRDVGLRPGGVTYIMRTEKDQVRYENWLASVSGMGGDSRLLSAEEVSALIPGMATKPLGALYTASDMRAEPWVAVPALAELAQREGVTIIEHCAVRGLDISAGRVSGVITEKGVVASSEVVVAGGAWSGLLLRRHGINIPQLSVRETVAATAPLPEIYPGAAADGKIAFRRRVDGGYTLAPGGASDLYIGPDSFRHLRHYLPQLRQDPRAVRYHLSAPKGYPDGWSTPRKWKMDAVSPFEKMRVLNPAPSKQSLAEIEKNFPALSPRLGRLKITKTWAGMIDTMPDFVPVVDRVDELPGLTVGTGMSGHGFGIGPAMGRILADLVAGQAPGHDLSRFRFGRFSDGSKLRLGPAL